MNKPYREPSFSLNDFRKWVSDHPGTGIRIIEDSGIKPGDQVLVRLSEENMVKKLKPMNSEKKEFQEICKSLKSNGGILQEIVGSSAQIRVLGVEESIVVPRLFLRRPKKK